MIYIIENEALQVKVNSLGSELWSLIDKKTGTQHLWQGDPAVWPRRAPNLFPVCGKLKGGKALINANEYAIPLHGFLRDYEHTLIEQTASRLRLRFTQNEETQKIYPFCFQVDTVFSLKGNTLIQAFEVTNTGAETLPFSIGYHAGYRCPFDEKHAVGDYKLVFDQCENATNLVNEDLIIVGEEPFLQEQRELKLRDGLFAPNFALTQLRSNSISIVEEGSGRALKVRISGFPAVVLWSAPGKVRFVCIEPWYGMFEPKEDYGEFIHKPLLQVLKAGGQFSCEQQITVVQGNDKEFGEE